MGTTSPLLSEFGTAARSRADETYAHIKQDIAEFRLLPGDRFTETEISERLGVSRTPVRQALFKLQQEGLVEVLFRSGWRVLPFDFDRFDDLYDLRMVLESTAVRRLCDGDAKAKFSVLDDLSTIWLVPVSQRSTEMQEVAQWDEAFHCALVEAAGNAEMSRVHREVTERIRLIRRLDFTQAARIDATYEEHGHILRAIARKHSDQASRLLSVHIRGSQIEVRKITLHQVYVARRQLPAAK